MDGFQDADGCPDPDNDGDGIPDSRDRCPVGAEIFNGFDDIDGCPDAAPSALDGLSGTVRGIAFKPGSSGLGARAVKVLEKVAVLLNAQPALRLTVEGHTDSAGRRGSNLALSQRRADAVVAWLAEKGVAVNRLNAVGLGPDRPDDPILEVQKHFGLDWRRNSLAAH